MKVTNRQPVSNSQAQAVIDPFMKLTNRQPVSNSQAQWDSAATNAPDETMTGRWIKQTTQKDWNYTKDIQSGETIIKQEREMQSLCSRDAASGACFRGCCGTTSHGMSDSPDPNSKSNTVSASRADFATATTSLFSPEAQFTNHESLPSLSKSMSRYNKVYAQYTTDDADGIREKEYSHLTVSNHVCLDYIGLGLFSHSQHKDRSFLETSSLASPGNSSTPFFDVCYKSASLKSQLLYGGQDSELESAIRKRMMAFLNISENDYSMVFTANRTSAFKLLAESYPFQSHPRLLTVYDYESEAVDSMIDNSHRRGAKVMSAEFSWPSMRIQSSKLRKMVTNKRKTNDRGLFVFPLQSKMTGARYSYLWMSVAKANGWHVVLDACSMGPKEMESLGLSLIQPDFLICSVFKVFGEDPSGFGCLFVKKSSAKILESSTMVTSIGIASLVPSKRFEMSGISETSSGPQQKPTIATQEDHLESKKSFSGPMRPQGDDGMNETSESSPTGQFEHGETSQMSETEIQVESEIVEVHSPSDSGKLNTEFLTSERGKDLVIECRGLDHADSLGLIKISNRGRCLINWLVHAFSKLQHPNSEEVIPLVRIYGPKVKFDRAPALAFNIFDWKGEKVEPVLVQKLADRSNISLSYGFLHRLCFSDKYEGEKDRVLETRQHQGSGTAGSKRKEKVDTGITAVTAALGFLTNFEDVYRLWAFVAQFLDADFVEKERWRYMSLNQDIVEV